MSEFNARDIPAPDLTDRELRRFKVRAEVRERMIEVWNMRSRDVIEWPTGMHVDELLNLAVMPVLDATTDW
jgi:hypothetical protein